MVEKICCFYYLTVLITNSSIKSMLRLFINSGKIMYSVCVHVLIPVKLFVLFVQE